jgi:uncharacterized protein (UPF0248 family)
MLPLHRLLSRIRWDPRFGQGEFALGYYDRVARRTLRVPLRAARFPPDDRRVFEIVDADGVARRIPLHRVRAVYRDGKPIWRRPARPW